MTSPPATAGFRHFHDQLGDLKDHLLTMAQRAEDLVELSVQALRERDVLKAEAVLAADAAIDALELEVEQRAISLLATQQPMARDLRFIIGAIKISTVAPR